MDFLKKLFQTKSKLLIDAIDKGDSTEVEKLLKKGADVNARNDKGDTVLYKAVLGYGWGNSNVLKLLLDYGANVNAKNINGGGPFSHAVYSGYLGLVELMFFKGVDVNAKYNDGKTPLHYAGDKEIAEFLLSHGADVNAKNNEGATPLHAARNMKMAELLLSNGADVDAKNNEGATPLHDANKKEEAELLLSHGADVDAKNNEGATPLHNAYEKEVAELLLSHGADGNAKDNEGRTPLHIAVMDRNLDVVNLLLANGAAVNARCFNGDTPLHKVAICNHGRRAAWDETERLVHNIQKERDRSQRQKDFFASLNRGHVNKWDAIGVTPPDSYYQKEFERILDERGKPEAQMVSMDRCKRVELLLAKGADINASNNEGETLLHLIVSNGDSAVAKLLIASGADVDVKNNKGRSPLNMIEEKNYRDLADLILGKRGYPDAKTSPNTNPTASPISSDNNAALEDIIKGAIEKHFSRLESQFTGEPEKQMLLQKVASTVMKFLEKVSEKATLTASDGKMHSFSSFDPSRKVRLEVTTIPCSPKDACAYFSNLFPGGYPDFMSKTLYLPNVYQSSLAEGIQIFAHLVVMSYLKDQQTSIVVHLCVAPNGEENQPYCPLLVLPADLLTPEQHRKWSSN